MTVCGGEKNPFRRRRRAGAGALVPGERGDERGHRQLEPPGVARPPARPRLSARARSRPARRVTRRRAGRSSLGCSRRWPTTRTRPRASTSSRTTCLPRLRPAASWRSPARKSLSGGAAGGWPDGCALLKLLRGRACVSPRVFWNVVRHGRVGKGVSFEAALKELVPAVNWDVLLSRSQREHQDGRYRL